MVRVQVRRDADSKLVYDVKTRTVVTAKRPPHMNNQEAANKFQDRQKE